MLETRMADPKPPFTASEQRDRLVWAEIAKERAAVDAKTARLKALRLARDAQEAADLAANPPPPPKKKKTAKKKEAAEG